MEKELGAALRRHKLDAHAAIALADVAAGGAAERSVEHLTTLAEAALHAACRHLCRSLVDDGFLQPADPYAPEADSGLIVLGMGKLGGRELNFSSDIDLIVLFDPDAAGVVKRDGLAEAMVKLVRRLVRLLSDRTADGYVFRTDLRLRPDPGATPLAIPVPAALQYYESPRPELGTRGHDQGPRSGRRHGGGARRSSPSCAPMSGAAIWISGRSPTFARSSARSPPTRAAARSRLPATT